jgi:hypothetical protein
MINWPENIRLKENKYSKWYSLLIEKAQARKLPKEIYTEGHHVIPKSWGGLDTRDNIVRLTAKEHYMAHAFLWKMNVSTGYHNKMMHAFNAMSIMKNGSYNKPGYKINSRLFESVRLERIAHLKTLKGPLSPAWGKKLNLSPESQAKKMAAVKEMWSDPERRSELLKARDLANQRPEVIAKREASYTAKRGVKRDPAIMEKCAVKKRGKKEHEIYSPDAILRRKEALKNRGLSDEAKEKMRLGLLAGCKKPKTKKPCPHCGKMCAGNMLAKWHGDNCKKKLRDGALPKKMY